MPSGDAAVHLTVGDQRIDDAAGILDCKKALDPNAPRLDVDFDLRHVTGIGERAGRIVMRARGKTCRSRSGAKSLKRCA